MVQSARIEHAVEDICRQGCAHVREVIVCLQAGNTAAVKELADISDSQPVLTELCAIMKVYDESGGRCCPVPGLADIKKAST